VQIRDNTLVSSTATLIVTVQNEAPTATFNEFTITSPASEGQLVTLRGRFDDTSGTHTATVQWGDGSTSTVPITPGSREFEATHVYVDDANAAGTATPSDVYRVLVTITDEAGASDTTPVGLFLEEVRNVRPSTLNVGFSSTSIQEGQAVTLNSLSFDDPGVLDVHTLKVNWGDGTQSLITLPVGVRGLSGLTTLQLAQLTHVYADDPSFGLDEYTITVELADDDEPQRPAQLTQIVSVANAIPSVMTPLLSPPVINENGLVTLSGLFTDPGVFDNHEVTVDWGDGSPKTRLNPAAGVMSFSGLTHQYLDDAPGSGNYTITISVTDNDSTVAGTTTVTAVVQNVAPILGGLQLTRNGVPLTGPINEGDEVTLTGSYTDVSPVDDHIVLIHWGDGPATPATPATVDPITRTFTARHRYRDNTNELVTTIGTGTGPTGPVFVPYVISVTVDDQDGGLDFGVADAGCQQRGSGGDHRSGRGECREPRLDPSAGQCRGSRTAGHLHVCLDGGRTRRGRRSANGFGVRVRYRPLVQPRSPVASDPDCRGR
jgi:hypothetical protein